MEKRVFYQTSFLHQQAIKRFSLLVFLLLQLIFKSEPGLSTDLGAERPITARRGQEKIAVEIKRFLRMSQVSELEKAMGQYELYRWRLQANEPDRELYVYCKWVKT